MLRNRKKVIKTVKKLDAFPKTHEECLETTTAGGTFSLISFGIMVWLIVWECAYHLETKFTFSFKADTDFKEKLKINFDITVGMPCNYVGADILDATGDRVVSSQDISMEETWFELDPDQLVHFQGIQRANNYFREQFHSIHEILWRSGYIDLFGGTPPRRRFPNRPKDACKIEGSIPINKVSGNFHILAGKTIQLVRGHAHIAMMMDEKNYNFSHRIDKLSFGDAAPGIIHPLEGDETVADKNMMLYQYFITIVPTRVNTYRHFGNSFQYSVSEQQREISHNKGSHGTPGIYFSYDVSALRVDVKEEHQPFLQFLTRLIGIIGGVFTCSGIMHRLIGVFVNCVSCRYFRSSGVKPEQIRAPLNPNTATLLSNANSPLLQSPFVVSTSTSTDAHQLHESSSNNSEKGFNGTIQLNSNNQMYTNER